MSGKRGKLKDTCTLAAKSKDFKILIDNVFTTLFTLVEQTISTLCMCNEVTFYFWKKRERNGGVKKK